MREDGCRELDDLVDAVRGLELAKALDAPPSEQAAARYRVAGQAAALLANPWARGLWASLKANLAVEEGK